MPPPGPGACRRSGNRPGNRGFGHSIPPLAPFPGVTPAPFDYLLYTSIPGSLRPERLDTLELGFLNAQWIEGLSFDGRLFVEKLHDYIDEVRHINGCNGCDTAGTVLPLLNPHDLLIHENAGWIDMTGADLHLRYALDDRTTLTGSFSIVRASGERIKRRDATGNVVSVAQIDDYVPKRTFSALLSHRFDHGWSGSLAWYAMSEMNWPNDGDRLAPYDRLDLRLARRLTLAGNNTQIELIAQNLLGNTYIEFRDDNQFERRFFIRLKIETP
ncbi:TonB-dependent receptor domain-containing protein [endosymbiont of unidentified scaly snail isolate Monju]|uniref:TonB-dependent receptor domain-containing protein n=1 Tax=endosymbiont of unidentified scaly snail isolate Monju TaxID=1248727 RepID=UPI0005B79FB2|nr:TonB-dependent receptor [endosymbiont of unidentified scaly snail isolate Monju]